MHFSALSAQTLEAIAEKYLRQLQQRVRAQGVELEFSAELAPYLGSRCGTSGGARQLRGMLQREVESQLATILLQNSEKPEKVRVTAQKGEIVCSC